MQMQPYTSAEVAPLQADIDGVPPAPQVSPQPINPRCIAATCGALAIVGLAAGGATIAMKQEGVPAQAPSMDETVGLDEEDEKKDKKKTYTEELRGKKIVLVATSAAYIGDHPTGVWLEELATPYYAFMFRRANVVIASPKGGPIPVDALSLNGDFFTSNAKDFITSAAAAGDMFHSKKLSEVDLEDVDALYFAGGHGACVDFGGDDVKKAVEEMYGNGKIIAFDCHGPCALYSAENEDGEPLVKGKKVTGFSDAEEEYVKMTQLVPKTPEAKLKKLGAKYEKGDPWTSHAVQDGNLITGQNPQSSEEAAMLVVKALSK